ncbi:DUF4245 domain-containing protein [Mycolicibacterium thermoresistibile]
MTTPPQPGRPPGPDPVGPQVPQPKPRILQDGRDMFWSMAPLVVACIVLAGMLGMCSFAPSGPTTGEIPAYDAPAALRADAAALDVPIRVPQLPEGWTSNSGGRHGIDGGKTDPQTGQQLRAVASRVGYLTPGGMYMALRQSNADEERLVGSINAELFPTGVQNVDGVRWVVYEGPGDTEPVWTARIDGPTGPAQLAITGAGTGEDFRTLAAETQRQQPLP